MHRPLTKTRVPTQPLHHLKPERFETVGVLKALAGANRQLAELKGVSASIPNQNILVATLGMQEAKDSSAIENIVTTHDELFRDALMPESGASPAVKEVLRYRQALVVSFEEVRKTGVLSNNHILRIQAALEMNEAGFRKVPGTTLKNERGAVVYTPPLPDRILPMMSDLERFMNEERLAVDPLIRMALIHHQFETIHPFYDGNGRTGRIINVLYLVKEGLLDVPVLYMSRYIIRTKDEYYRLLQSVREHDAWEEWVTYMLTAVAESARDGIRTVADIKSLLLDYKHRIRQELPKIYSQDLINNIFSHPYTKIQFVEDDLGVSRLTATKYLDKLSAAGFLVKEKAGRSSFYLNMALYDILTAPGMQGPVR
ncbi:MAG: Fic family protein [Gemmatimonadaceae bacterium]